MTSPMADGPLHPPLPKPIPDTGPRIVVAAFTTWSLTVVFVLLRFYTRARIVRTLGPSDWCIALAVIFSGGLSGAIYRETRHGMGKHVWDIDVPKEFPSLLHAWWWSVLCYQTTLAFSKISICLLYLTIFTLEWARRACYVVLSVVIFSNVWAFITVVTNTIPLAATWDSTVVATYTTSQDIWWAVTGFAVGTDILIFLLPIPIILPLKLPRRQKLAVMGIFLVGVFTVGVAITRLVILVEEKDETDPDWTYNGTDLTYWTIIEINIAIVVSCVMTFKPLMTKVFPGLLDSRMSSDDPSLASSGPPLTIGSKPSRNPLSPAQHDSWIEIPGQIDRGDTMLRDLEAGPTEFDPKPRLSTGAPSSESLAQPSGVDKKDTIRVDINLVEAPRISTDAASVRTSDLGRIATARSIG